MSLEMWVLVTLAALPGLLVLVPAGVAQQRCALLRRLATSLMFLQFIAAALCLLAYLLPAFPKSESGLRLDLGWSSFQVTGMSGLMFTLVSFIGWVTSRFSIRYLDGEPMQGRYFQWLGFTVTAVSLMVLAADLLTFCVLWSLTSLGLHQLLLHYPERAAAQRAAWTKFSVSRIGDVALIGALVLFTQSVSSLDFAKLAEAALNPAIGETAAFQLAVAAMTFGVIAKSAQIPFHTWLPLTMETPTPVSALMHAGIVNAGGYLLVRTSPLLSYAPAAQLMLVLIGTLTACVASIIMLTQTSVKKKLAYSTISQMGFMLMQCGLGAYSAAMLHILAHSLFKAYEFLTSGTVVVERAAVQGALKSERAPRWPAIATTMAALLAVTWSMLVAVGVDPVAKSGGWLLALLLCSSITYWIMQTAAVGQISLTVQAALAAIGLIALYSVSFAVVDGLLAVPSVLTSSNWLTVNTAIVLVAFAGLFVLQFSVTSNTTSRWMRSMQIHASNGFYIESWLRRKVWLLKA